MIRFFRISSVCIFVFVSIVASAGPRSLETEGLREVARFCKNNDYKNFVSDASFRLKFELAQVESGFEQGLTFRFLTRGDGLNAVLRSAQFPAILTQCFGESFDQNGNPQRLIQMEKLSFVFFLKEQDVIGKYLAGGVQVLSLSVMGPISRTLQSVLQVSPWIARFIASGPALSAAGWNGYTDYKIKKSSLLLEREKDPVFFQMMQDPQYRDKVGTDEFRKEYVKRQLTQINQMTVFIQNLK